MSALVVSQMSAGLALGAFALFFTVQGAVARCADHVPQPKPQNASRDIVGHDLDTIMDRGFMTIAVYEDYPPYSYKEGGKPAGIDIEIGKIIAADLGVEPRFNFVAAGENLDADLRNNIWKGPLIGGDVSNVMLRVPYDSEFTCRVEQVVFTGQYHQESVAIAYSEETYPEDPPTPAYFRFDKVGVENDSIADFYLSNLGFGGVTENIRRYPSTVDAMVALAAGDIAAVMGQRSQLDSAAGEGVGVHEPPLTGFARSKWTIGAAINFRYRGLSYSVDDAIHAALADGRIRQIFEDYGVTHQEPVR